MEKDKSIEEETEEIIEGGTYDSRSGDYHLAIEKTTLQEIKKGQEVSDLVLEVLDTIGGIRQGTRYELILGLLSKEDKNKLSERIVDKRDIDKKQVTIKIADDVLDILLERENDNGYEQRYGPMSRKMIFHVNDGIYKDVLKEQLKQYKKKEDNG